MQHKQSFQWQATPGQKIDNKPKRLEHYGKEKIQTNKGNWCLSALTYKKKKKRKQQQNVD